MLNTYILSIKKTIPHQELVYNKTVKGQCATPCLKFINYAGFPYESISYTGFIKLFLHRTMATWGLKCMTGHVGRQYTRKYYND